MLRSLFGSTAQPAGLANLLTEAAYDPTQPFIDAPTNDRFGKTVPLA